MSPPPIIHSLISTRSIANPYLSVCNLGGTFPRYFVLRLVDAFTSATCNPAPKSSLSQPFSCALQPDKERCLAAGGTCDVTHDGYYLVNMLCVVFGIVTFALYIRPKVTQLQSLPLRAWRLASSSSSPQKH